VASMLAYERKDRRSPGAFIYFHEEGDPQEEPYFYTTRRPYSVTGNDILVVGGPQTMISGEIDHREEYPEDVYDRIDGFMSRSFPEELGEGPSMCWNGLMGYTEDGLRLVGPDPEVPGLWYNLGCNGVGLLSSVVGGKKLTDLIKGHRIMP
jgi:glycine/D-amino acid oxidase-like deaminating enzyme